MRAADRPVTGALGDTLDNLRAAEGLPRRPAALGRQPLTRAAHPPTRERTLLQVTLADRAATTGTWQAVSRKLLASSAQQEPLIEALLTLASS
jgi:hypothetical protein